MSKRTTSLLLTVLMILTSLSVLAGCRETPPDYSNEKTDFIFELDKQEFTANTINCAVSNQDIAVFTKGYLVDGVETAYIGGDHTGRTVISVRYNASYDEYTITQIIDGDGEKGDTLIPVNGFVISIVSSLIEELRVKESQVVDVYGYDDSNYETLSLATVIPSKSDLARRVYYVDPVSVPEEDLIYFVTEDYDKDTALGNNVLALLLEHKNGSNYTVKSLLKEGTVSAGEVALIFKGIYNCEYAVSVFKEGNNVMLSNLENANSVCHESAIELGDKIYKIGAANTNVATISDGVYLFDSANVAGATPASDKDFVAIAVDGGKVMYVGEKNERLVIPTNSGYVLVFAGDKSELAEQYQMGDTVKELLVFPENAPEKFVKINGHYYNFTNIDVYVPGEATLFTHAYGETTGTSGSVVEIAFKNGAVVGVTTSGGNTAIPEDGYVISVLARGDNLANAKKVKISDEVRLALDVCNYTLTDINIDCFNDTRLTDYLVIYNISNTFTNTNQYGFEIGVDENGIMIAASNAGNMRVPKNGFVISGHGKNAALLMDLYMYGASVKCLKEENKVVFYSTPLSASTDISASLEAMKDRYVQAENALYDIDYNGVSAKLDKCQKMIESVDTAIEDGDPINAVNNLYTITLLLSDLENAMITQKAVEERSVWYRSTVKSDDDVLAVIKKCVEYNINAIYLETWYNGRTIGMTENPLIQHFSSQHGDYDALEGFIRIGHEHGIQIHAWVENFFVGTDADEADPNHIINHNKDWILLDKNGRDYYASPEYGNFKFLNPQNEECRELVLSIYREMLENYDLDGLHLDYIRYPEHNGSADFGYNPDTIATFQAEYGYTTDPHNYVSGTAEYRDWIEFRQNVITSFVAEVFELVKEVKPEIWITTACYPSLTDSPNNIYQCTAEWVKLGYVDQVFSMTYSDGTEYVSSNAGQFFAACKNKAFYSTGLTLFSGNSGAELLKQIEAVRASGATGQAYFSLSSLLGYEEYEKIIATAYPQKAVSVFDIDAAIIAYTADLIDKCDGVYSQRTEGQQDVISSIKSILNEIKLEAEKQEYVTVEEQKLIVEFTLEKVEEMISASANAQGALKAALENEIGEMEYNLSIMKIRLDARLS